MKTFKRILIANRGEIAIRVMKTCREMGIESVCLYTDEEIDLPHSSYGDISVGLGSGPLADTYLNIDKLVQICKDYKVDAVHPGYGLLSERAAFANALEKAGITLIGPPAKAMEAMGDKKRSKQICEEAGIPLVPGYHGENQEADFLFERAKEIGLPVLIKASAGGGGKGMRIVEKEEDFLDALAAAKREAMNAFGDDIVLIEKFIVNPRHIEVQVMSDQHGNHLHFFERECSIQRRYQKIVEESPAPGMEDDLRQSICAVATKISKSIDYVGAGTVEFILDEDGSFYFLEMNTRLQVEHPVTEMVTGADLVRLQVEVAQGAELNFSQSDIEQRGHSIEVRIYAEDPDNDFMPSIGKLLFVGETQLNQVRLDTGYRNGNEVTVSFDPMLAKLIVHAQNRGHAIDKMLQALKDFPFLGLTTNRDYLSRILKSEPYKVGPTYTHFVKTYKDILAPKEMTDTTVAQVLTAYQLMSSGASRSTGGKEAPIEGPWASLSGLRNT